ncbi:MAG: SDR family oxidoreductase [Anaerolineaceae bacterium]|nr:SDR family oxidoreductase [Anaerolineaceae bacterium]
MTRFLVTGASGLLGLNFSLRVGSEHQVVGVVNQQVLYQAPFPTVQVDLSEKGAVETLIKQTHPDVVLHCAALANVDTCELEPERAFRVNAELPGELAAACKRENIKLLHISTDAVFDGQKGAYSETDAPQPINTYARTKLAGERAVQDTNPDAIIARVNFYGWSLTGRRSLAEIFYTNLSSNQTMRGFTDVFFCQFYVDQLTEILLQMVKKKLKGLYHTTSPESLSKHHFGKMIAEQFGLNAGLLIPSSWQEAGLKAVRSPNLTLDSRKLSRDLEMTLPGQKEGVRLFYSAFCAGLPKRICEMGRSSA